MYYTYSWRDGNRELTSLDPDDVMEALSDDLMAEADLQTAMERITRYGLRTPGSHSAQGTHGLLQQVRSQRREDLERYDLDSMVQDIKERVSDIVSTERSGIEHLLREAQAPHLAMTPEDQRAVESVAVHRLSVLEAVPDEPGSAVTALADYEFANDFARTKFDALMDVLQRQVLQTRFKHMQQSMQGLTPDDIASLTRALHALNNLIEDRASTYPQDFEQFRERHGSHFPSSNDLDGLLTHLMEQAVETESLLSSMAPELRRTLEESMGSALRDPGLRDEMARLHGLMEQVTAAHPPVAQYPFSGEHSVTFDEALGLMRRMQRLDQLERALRVAHDTASMNAIDPDTVRDLLGAEAHEALCALRSLEEVLEHAGYLEREGETVRLTPRGIRRIGQKALHDIFRDAKQSAFGDHTVRREGAGSDAMDDSKPYEYGGPFLLDLSQTLMNAVAREQSPGTLKLSVSDFEVFCTEQVSQAATVLMVDLSRSMPMRGCFTAAKKVALALNTLITNQFPRDQLYVVGFSDYARQFHAESLYRLGLNEYVHGTNIQHGLKLARRLLAGHKSGTRQIILITDGEPTAHLEDDRVHFSYPPSARTIQATLREVQRCTREHIVINTFMLERSHHLVDFVNQMTRINHGRVFFATPERLGNYILVDYVRGRRRVV
ncbi:MAG TPA: VWA domain-containing protein [Chloroflexota bacterium]